MSGEITLRPVPLAITESLTQQDASALPIYLPGSPNKPPILYRESGYGLKKPDFGRLRDSGVPYLLVRAEDLPQCERALEEKLGELIQNPAITTEQKATCVQQVGTLVARKMLDFEGTIGQLDRASSLLDNLIGAVLSDHLVAANLLHMSAHHRSTASHMFAVSFLAILLGTKVLGPRSDELKAIGLAGMLHDLGKMNIPESVLNKTTPLTAEEKELIRQHPIESVRLIGENPLVSSQVRQMILQHHERSDGRGYPLGLTSDALLVGGKIVAIVDVFHALIGPRSYRQSLTPAEAVYSQGLRAGKHFDHELYRDWRQVFHQYWGAVQGTPLWEAREPDVSPSFHSDHHVASSPGTRRQSPRLPCQGRVDVKCVYVGRLCRAHEGPLDFSAQLHDLSKSGFCLYSSHPMYRGEVVHSLIGSSEQEIWVRAVVRWCKHHAEDNHYRVGVQFEHRVEGDGASEGAEVLSLDDPRLFTMNAKPAAENPAVRPPHKT